MDFPIHSMVDLSSSLCNKLPEGSSKFLPPRSPMIPRSSQRSAPPKLCPDFVPDALVGYSNGQALKPWFRHGGATVEPWDNRRCGKMWPWKPDGLELETPGNHQKHHQKPSETSSNFIKNHKFGGHECHDTWKMRMSRTLGKHLNFFS